MIDLRVGTKAEGVVVACFLETLLRFAEAGQFPMRSSHLEMQFGVMVVNFCRLPVVRESCGVVGDFGRLQRSKEEL